MFYDEFIEMASGHGLDTKDNRAFLCARYKVVTNSVDCMHCLSDPLHISHEALCSQDLDGPIFEFGCYMGGMTAKLSVLAHLLGRQLKVFDTFAGLPYSRTYSTHQNVPAELGDFRMGQFSCPIEQVKRNVRHFGRIDRCTFIEGLIEETLPVVDERPSLVFIDVDLHETAMFVVAKLWRRIQNDKLFTHEACISGYMEKILDPKFWSSIGCRVPSTGTAEHGLEFGLPGSNCLTYLVKSL